MAYDKHTWSTGEVITAARLNNIEDGIKDHDNNITSIDNSITNILTDIGNLATLGEKYASDFAVKQTSTTASQAFAVGEFLTLAGQLYRVTNAIASGEELAVGTNIEASNVGAELVSLKNSITTLNDSLTNGLFKLKSYSFSYSLSAGSDFHTAFIPSETGYYPLGIIRFSTNDVFVVPISLNQGSGEYSVVLHNTGTGNRSATLQLIVLFYKGNVSWIT